jgi:hypothetical protein
MSSAGEAAKPRYIVVYSAERSEMEQKTMGDGFHLVDTLTDESVWGDEMEPEDAILVRDLAPLVDMLNAATKPPANPITDYVRQHVPSFAYTDEGLLRRAIRNARSSFEDNGPVWVGIKHHFKVGSTVAAAMFRAVDADRE